jgi:hypothetical protein
VIPTDQKMPRQEAGTAKRRARTLT